MDQQVVIEFIELIGSRRVDFNDPVKVKLSPHSLPILIHGLINDYGKVIVHTGNGEVLYENLQPEVKGSILQRLRLILKGYAV